MVRTHLRARAAQAGALLAVVFGGIFVAPAVAFADPPNVEITDLQTEVPSGGRLTMQFQVASAGDNQGQVPATITVNGGGMDCNGGDCRRIAQIGGDGREFSVQLTAPEVNDGETRQVTVEIVAAVPNEQPGRASQQITIKGPDRPQTVRQVSGRVKDQDGKSIAGATIGMKDSAGRVFRGTSDGSGRFSFTSSDNKPIAPGRISIGAAKDGFDQVDLRRDAEAGQNLTVSLTLKAEAVATPSSSPTPSPSATSSPPAEEPTEEPTADEPTETTQTETDQAASTEDGGVSMLYIVIGVLLVAAGIGAIVLVMLRRRNSGDNGDDDDPTGLSGSGGVVPPSQGRFADATRVGAPVGGGGNDATMIAHMPPSGGPSMADAPTMLHRPVPPAEDEFPDPYGVPLPQHGGFAGAPAGDWDDAPQYGGTQQYGGGTQQYGGGGTQPYSEPTSYGRPPEDDGYGAAAQPAGNYGAYGEATGMYRPEAENDGGYGAPQYGGNQYGGTQQYGAEPAGGYPPGGYGQEQPDQGGYAPWGAAADAPDNNGYGPQGSGQYPAGQQYGGQGTQQYGGGYDDGYQAEQRGGYESYQGGGYDERGAHDEQYGQGGPRDQHGTGQHGGEPPRDTPAPRRGGHDY
ncbi:carboxypeptidase-like regulatory domain-containing protein [Actinoplanes sp. M2I2]|uniref:carboxypeptidase-like regulatory domain-containing protein n=1 Tax=Actinoplanes sp. M2I2 TaxID=1734444 RepID=UPI0020206B83|nr:carboxypeptidase regulatory-like domain-containing protein [Actinoplanes sp. M2I2]